MKLTSKDDLLKYAARRYKIIEHPKFGSFRIQSLSQGDWGRIEAAAVEGGGLAAVGTRMIATAMVNEKDNRLFGDSARDLQNIENLDCELTRWLYRQIEQHCGLDAAATEDELKKTDSDNSPTD